MLFGFFQKSKAQSVGSSGAPLLLRTLVAALSKVEDRHTEVRSGGLCGHRSPRQRHGWDVSEAKKLAKLAKLAAWSP